MKNIKWLLAIAEKKPLIFSLALLMIGISTLALVVLNRDKKAEDCEEEIRKLQESYSNKMDSLSVYYRHRERQLNEETRATLSLLIEEYKKQVEEQREINERVNTTIDKNDKLIKTNKKVKN
jgi:hypothetical protein